MGNIKRKRRGLGMRFHLIVVSFHLKLFVKTDGIALADCAKKGFVHLMPSFIALQVFNDLETCRPYKLMINLKIVKFVKKFIERFPNYYYICRRRPNYMQK